MIEVGKEYRHFKGNVYIAVVRAKDSETEEPVVVYTRKPTPGVPQDGIYWVRSAKMFEEEVQWPDGVMRPRFTRVDSLPESAQQ